VYLIDTMVLSELRRLQRDPGVVAGIARQQHDDLFLSVVSIGVVSIGEIERDIARQRSTDPAFAEELATWLKPPVWPPLIPGRAKAETPWLASELPPLRGVVSRADRRSSPGTHRVLPEVPRSCCDQPWLYGSFGRDRRRRQGQNPRRPPSCLGGAWRGGMSFAC
jgi:hypothetical protein